MRAARRAKKAYKANSERNKTIHIKEKIAKFKELIPRCGYNDSLIKSIMNNWDKPERRIFLEGYFYEDEIQVINDIESGIAFSSLYNALRE